MITRRDLIAGVIAAATTLALAVFAQSAGKPLNSCVFAWDTLKPVPNEHGARREVYTGPTATLDKLDIHITTVNPGESPHLPHRHPEEELVILKDGELEAMQNGVTNVVGPGSIIFEASGQFHGFHNSSKAPATYYVIKWTPPGGVKTKPE